MDDNRTMTHNAQIHQADQQGGNIIGQLKCLTDALKNGLRLPEELTKDLIKALSAQRIFQKQKHTTADYSNKATFATLSVQNEDVFFDVNDELISNDGTSEDETDSDANTEITMFRTQIDGHYDLRDNDEQVETELANSNYWEHHRKVMDRVTDADKTTDAYENAHERYIETADDVMNKLTLLTDFLEMETEDNHIPQMESGHTLHRLHANFNVSNLINPMEQTNAHKEDTIQTRLFTMSTAQIRSLRQKTHPTRLTKFNTAAENLITVQNRLLTFSLQISTIPDRKRRNWQIQEKINDVALAVQQLKVEESKLEDLLQTLSTATHNCHQIKLPPRYGNITKLKLNDFINCTKYMPNGKSKLSHVWTSMLERGKLIGKKSKEGKEDDCLSEDAWKDALSQHMLGEALDYLYTYNHLPLSQLLEKLFHRFEKIPSRWELQHEVDSFKKDPKDSLSCTIEKLRLILSKLYQDKQPTESEILTRRTIRDKIINNSWLPKDIIRHILQEENDARATCQSYCFETRAKDMDYWSKQTDGDLYHKHEDLEGSLHAMATKRQEIDPLKRTHSGRVDTHNIANLHLDQVRHPQHNFQRKGCNTVETDNRDTPSTTMEAHTHDIPDPTFSRDSHTIYGDTIHYDQ